MLSQASSRAARGREGSPYHEAEQLTTLRSQRARYSCFPSPDPGYLVVLVCFLLL